MARTTLKGRLNKLEQRVEPQRRGCVVIVDSNGNMQPLPPGAEKSQTFLVASKGEFEVKEVTDLINQAKESITRAQLIGEQMRQRWEREAQERAIRRRSGRPVIRVMLAPPPKTSSQKAVEKWRQVWGGIAQ